MRRIWIMELFVVYFLILSLFDLFCEDFALDYSLTTFGVVAITLASVVTLLNRILYWLGALAYIIREFSFDNEIILFFVTTFYSSLLYLIVPIFIDISGLTSIAYSIFIVLISTVGITVDLRNYSVTRAIINNLNSNKTE